MEFSPTSKMKIGIIEADKYIAEVFKMAFEAEGHDVVHLEHAKLAEEQNFHRFIRRHRPPLVLFDVPYPFEQNWELYQRLIHTKGNSRRRFIPMGTFDHQFTTKLQELGQPYLSKPFELDHLDTLVQDHYPRRKTTRKAPHVQPAFQNLVLPSSREPVFLTPGSTIRRGL